MQCLLYFKLNMSSKNYFQCDHYPWSSTASNIPNKNYFNTSSYKYYVSHEVTKRN